MLPIEAPQYFYTLTHQWNSQSLTSKSHQWRILTITVVHNLTQVLQQVITWLWNSLYLILMPWFYLYEIILTNLSWKSNRSPKKEEAFHCVSVVILRFFLFHSQTSTDVTSSHAFCNQLRSRITNVSLRSFTRFQNKRSERAGRIEIFNDARRWPSHSFLSLGSCQN